MSLLDDIRLKGHWNIVIRPLVRDANRVADLGSIVDLLRRIQVTRRGWHFPHVHPSNPPLIGNEWVGQDTNWEAFREIWRVTRSGQFLHVAGIRYDWGAARHFSPLEHVPPEQSVIGLGDSLHRLSEAYEFAQRWAQSVAPESGVSLGMELNGLLGRRLVIDDPGRGATSTPYVGTAEEPWSTSAEIFADSSLDQLRGLARAACTSMSERFGMSVGGEVLEAWQGRIGS